MESKRLMKINCFYISEILHSFSGKIIKKPKQCLGLYRGEYRIRTENLWPASSKYLEF